MVSTYFEGAPEIQPANNLQTLYLMSPPQQSSFIFLSQQHLVGIPLHHQPQNSIDFQSQQGWPSAPAPVSAQQGLSLKLSATTTNTGDGSMTMTGRNGVLGSDKYLKAAQQLLDEVVNMNNEQVCRGGMATMREKGRKDKSEARGKMGRDGSGGDLSVAERQEVQMKKAKLVNMLDEVEQRYRQYQQQMQTVVSTFEAAAGYGSGTAYTALALKTISKQFHSLKNAISERIRATSRRLGDEEEAEDRLDAEGTKKKSVGPRLKWVGHQLGQQRGLAIHVQNAWRPQRGLPEQALSVLRAWLFEHFLHPYPKDSDKHMLAKQTGLTRSQVSNWFINARVRLWKPMVEEMYLEETKQQDHNNNSDSNRTRKSESSEHLAPNPNSHRANSSSPPRSDQNEGLNSIQNYRLLDNHSDETILQQRLKRARSDNSFNQANIPNQMRIEMKSDNHSDETILQQRLKRARSDNSFNQANIPNQMRIEMKSDKLSNH